jgi:hypothetical protein
VVDVKRERDWGDWFASLNDLGDKAELTLGAVLVAALSAMGLGVFFGASALASAFVGVVVGAIAVTAVWLRARRRGESLWPDE